jgi:uncharacterized membrane protein YdbT with pleckstrin-like domain
MREAFDAADEFEGNAMSYVRKNLIPGETLIYATGVHWSVLFWPVILVLIVVGGGVAALVWGTFAGKIEIGTLLIGAGLVYLLFAVMKRAATEIAVTNRRVIIKTGMASRHSLEIMLQKVESIGINETTWGRILGYGSVMIHGTGGTPEPFHKIAHPSEFRKHVQEQIDLNTRQ